MSQASTSSYKLPKNKCVSFVFRFLLGIMSNVPCRVLVSPSTSSALPYSNNRLRHVNYHVSSIPPTLHVFTRMCECLFDHNCACNVPNTIFSSSVLVWLLLMRIFDARGNVCLTRCDAHQSVPWSFVHSHIDRVESTCQFQLHAYCES